LVRVREGNWRIEYGVIKEGKTVGVLSDTPKLVRPSNGITLSADLRNFSISPRGVGGDSKRRRYV